MKDEDEALDRKTIAEMLESFKKHLWGNDQPMLFAVAVVEEMLLEIQRQQTVMRASADELHRHWDTHTDCDTVSLPQLQNLAASLTGERKGFYAQYLSPPEYHEFVLRQSSFDTFAKSMEHKEVTENEQEGTEQEPTD